MTEITVSFTTDLSSVASVTELPELPEHLKPEVSFEFSNGRVETRVAFDGEGANFWTDGDEQLNSSEYMEVWPDLSEEDREAALEWGTEVHGRIDSATYGLMIDAAFAPGVTSEILKYATLARK
jgi:hypothetical protein